MEPFFYHYCDFLVKYYFLKKSRYASTTDFSSVWLCLQRSWNRNSSDFRQASVYDVDYLWTSRTDFFQILGVAWPGLNVRTFLEFLKWPKMTLNITRWKVSHVLQVSPSPKFQPFSLYDRPFWGWRLSLNQVQQMTPKWPWPLQGQIYNPSLVPFHNCAHGAGPFYHCWQKKICLQ